MPRAKAQKDVKAKKSKPKKSNKGEKPKIFKDTKPEYFFLMIDGSAVKNLLELADAFNNMSDDVFYYHVTNDRNDFSSWVRDVFNEKQLSEQLGMIHSRMESQVAVLRHILAKLL